MIKKKLIACSKKVKIDNELNLNDLKEYKTLTLFLKDKSLKSLRNSIKMFETFKKLINNLQNEILNKFSPNIIHVYDVKNVNKFWIGNSPKNFEYSKISLYESNTLSLFIFIPKNNIAITPPHSHYATDAITFTSKQAIEYELPVTINQRQREISILRTIGAHPFDVLKLILYECVLVTVLGVLLGLVLTIVFTNLLKPWVEAELGVHINPILITSAEINLCLLIIGAGIAVGFIPAMIAYRRSLSESIKDGL